MKKEQKEKRQGEDYSDVYGFLRSLGVFSLSVVAMIGYIIIFFNIADF